MARRNVDFKILYNNVIHILYTNVYLYGGFEANSKLIVLLTPQSFLLIRLNFTASVFNNSVKIMS